MVYEELATGYERLADKYTSAKKGGGETLRSRVFPALDHSAP